MSLYIISYYNIISVVYYVMMIYATEYILLYVYIEQWLAHNI